MTDQKPPDLILKALGEPFPRQAIKSRQGGGGKSFSYIETHAVIHRLNSATNGCWDFRVVNVEWRADLLIVQGELTIPGLGTRAGFGVQKVAPNAGEDLVKGGASDSLKKCATLFGVALDLYGPDYEGAATPTPAPATRAPANERRAPQSVPEPTIVPIDREKVIQRLHSYVPHDALHNWAVSNDFDSLADVSTDDLVALGKSFKTGGATPFMERHGPAAGQSSIDGLDDLHAQLDRQQVAERARQ